MASLASAYSRRHHGAEIGIEWVLAYIAVGIVTWIICAIILIRHEQVSGGRPADNGDKVLAVMAGMVAGAAWPLALVGFGVWKIVERFVRQPVGIAKRDR